MSTLELSGAVAAVIVCVWLVAGMAWTERTVQQPGQVYVWENGKLLPVTPHR